MEATFQGRALLIGSLALSRVCYVASLVPMPLWVHAVLAKLIFPFLWRGKQDLVAQGVVTKPQPTGGSSVVDIKLKVASLLVQWVRRFASSLSGWVTFFSYLVSVQFHATVDAVLGNSSALYSGLPPPLLLLSCLAVCWQEVEGSYS